MVELATPTRRAGRASRSCGDAADVGREPDRDASTSAARLSDSFGWPNFGKMLLVFGCIGSDFARKYAFCSIFQNLPDYQAEFFEIWQNFANFAT